MSKDYQMILRVAILLIIVALVTVWATKANAAEIYRAEAEGTTISLHSEDCRVQGIANLKRRATWTQDGKTTEGCYGGHPDYPIVIFYWADRTVTVLHTGHLQKVQGI